MPQLSPNSWLFTMLLFFSLGLVYFLLKTSLLKSKLGVKNQKMFNFITKTWKV